MAHLVLAAVGYFAVHLPGGWIVGVDVTLTRHKLPPDVVLQNQVRVGLRALRHG